MEINSVLVLLAGFVSLRYFGAGAFGQLQELMRSYLENLATVQATPATLSALAIKLGLALLSMVFPFVLCIMIAGVVGNIAQSGFLFTTKPLVPDFSRINPGRGFSRLFSKHSLVELVKSIAKLAIISFIVYQVFQSKYALLVNLLGDDFQSALRVVADGAMEVGIKSGLVLLVLAVLDYGFQRWQFEKNLRMTRTEVREELRRSEGSPQLKGRIRQQQRQLAARRMMQSVPHADVVITNPTHLAVALEYKPESMRSPKVTAKGERLVAERIKAVAREHGVPVLENKPLARVLFNSVDIGMEIPATLYQAVAEVLAFIFSLRREHRWQAQR